MSDPTFNEVSQFAHFFAAAFVVLALHTHHWIVPVVLVAAAIKELVRSPLRDAGRQRRPPG